MSEKNIQAQIDDINRKLDLVLEEMAAQRSRREETDDLLKDINIISKDAVATVTEELDKSGIAIDTASLTNMGIKVLHNLDNLNDVLSMLESINDLAKDMGPIVTQSGLDAIKMMHELQEKGYFDFIREFVSVADNIVEHFTVQDVRELADNVVTILETVKRMTQPDMLEAANNAIMVFKNIETEQLPEYSLWKAFKEMRTPEMKRGMGFMITFLKNLAGTNTALQSGKIKSKELTEKQ